MVKKQCLPQLQRCQEAPLAVVGPYKVRSLFCTKTLKNDVIQFLVTKSGQNWIWTSDPNPRPPNCMWTYLLLSSQNDRNIENLRGDEKPIFSPPPAVFEVTIWERLSWCALKGNSTHPKQKAKGAWNLIFRLAPKSASAKTGGVGLF